MEVQKLTAVKSHTGERWIPDSPGSEVLSSVTVAYSTRGPGSLRSTESPSRDAHFVTGSRRR